MSSYQAIIKSDTLGCSIYSFLLSYFLNKLITLLSKFDIHTTISFVSFLRNVWYRLQTLLYLNQSLSKILHIILASPFYDERKKIYKQNLPLMLFHWKSENCFFSDSVKAGWTIAMLAPLSTVTTFILAVLLAVIIGGPELFSSRMKIGFLIGIISFSYYHSLNYIYYIYWERK